MGTTERFKTLVKEGRSDSYQEGFQGGWHEAAAGRPQKDRATLDREAFQAGLLEEEFSENAEGYANGYAERKGGSRHGA
jgi:hypothetical protein